MPEFVALGLRQLPFLRPFQNVLFKFVHCPDSFPFGALGRRAILFLVILIVLLVLLAAAATATGVFFVAIYLFVY